LYNQNLESIHADLFAGVDLDHRVLDAFKRMGKVQAFSNLETICKIDKKSYFIGFIVKGKATILDAHGATLAQVREGGIFGEVSFILDSTHTANVVGVGDGLFLRLEFQDINRFFESNPELHEPWVAWLSVQMAKRLTMFVNDMREYVALIAHDEKKETLINFAIEHYDLLYKVNLIATATTGRHLLEKASLNVSRSVSSGPIGGDQAIGSLITTGNIKAVIFFKDPLNAHPHGADIEALSRLCDVHNVPLATNTASAKLMLKGLLEDNHISPKLVK
jgi:methylglyoxal synthase